MTFDSGAETGRPLQHKQNSRRQADYDTNTVHSETSASRTATEKCNRDRARQTRATHIVSMTQPGPCSKKQQQQQQI